MNASAYYEQCTLKYLRSRYEETVSGWQCECGASFSTQTAPDHKCHPVTIAPLVKIDWPVTAEKK